MKKNNLFKLSFFVLISIINTPRSWAWDKTRYPEDNLSNAGEFLNTVQFTFEELFPIFTQFSIDPTFTANQKEIVKKASTILVERILNKNVHDCAFKHAKKNVPKDKSDFLYKLVGAFNVRSIQGEIHAPSLVFVARVWDEPKTVGVAFFNLFFDTTKPMPGFKNRHYFHFALNSDYIGDKSSYIYANDSEYWAGVMAHEALRNLGYEEGNEPRESFTEEFALCLWQEGARPDLNIVPFEIRTVQK